MNSLRPRSGYGMSLHESIDYYSYQSDLSGGDGDRVKGGVTDLFGKYNAGYIGDENTSQLFPNQSYNKDGAVTRYMVEGVGVWVLGMVNSGAGAVAGGLAVTIQMRIIYKMDKGWAYTQLMLMHLEPFQEQCYLMLWMVLPLVGIIQL